MEEIHDSQGKVVALVPRLGDMRKNVYTPTCSPDSRIIGESYRVVAIRSTCRIPLSGGQYCIHRGPYAVLWEDEHLVSNPEKPVPNEPGYNSFDMRPAYLLNEYIVTRHDEDQHIFEVLLRTLNKQEARQCFDDLEKEFPESDLPRSPYSHVTQSYLSKED